ncbi:chitobiase/beta-hexosaminidase C-terminal domain-containing protein [Candidatus Roizmanbacteria bacterium]|nr:chitobiase/beta-hexosaminidase C-terminal domain-containing protein [Candidatus Roizmanbacteria bacterium]
MNLADLSTLLANFGRPLATWSNGDFDGNGSVALADLSILLSNFGQNAPSPTPTTNPQLTIQFTPDEGTYTSSFNLDLYVPQAETYEIYYTTNGTTPNNTGNGTLYTGDLTISQTTSVRAIAYATGYPTSTVHTKIYTLNIENQTPAANSQILNTTTNTALPITLSYADSDGPGPYTFTILTNPQNGTLSGTGGSRTYTPNNNFSGSDSFNWRVNDGQTNSNIATVTINVTSSTNSALIFDHTDVVAPQDMSRIPIQYLDIARNRRVFFRHASIGFNIWDGLECMMSSSPASFCTRNAPAGTFINDPVRYTIPNFAKFSTTSQWVEECHSLNLNNCNPISHEKSGYFLQRLNGESWPSTDYPEVVDTSQMDIVMFKFGNVDDQSTSSIATWYFTQGHQYTDIYDLKAYADTHSNQTMVFWSMPLGRLVSNTSMTFNQNIRTVAQNEDLILFDLADITSHLPDGASCTNVSGIPNLCDEYTDEVNGGHLNGYGKARVTQALWAFMARLAGWDGSLN